MDREDEDEVTETVEREREPVDKKAKPKSDFYDYDLLFEDYGDF